MGFLDGYCWSVKIQNTTKYILNKEKNKSYPR